MFLNENMRKYYNSILTFIVNSIFWSNHSGVFLKIVIQFRYTWGISVGGLISSKTAGSLSAVLVEVGSFVCVYQVFCLFYYLLCERLFFWEASLSDCFIMWRTLSILILHGRKVFWRALFKGGFSISVWYGISCLLNNLCW